MSVILGDGFDHLLAAAFTAKGWSVNPSSTPAGRISGNAMRLQAAATGSLVTTGSAKSFASSATTVIMGFAFKPVTLGSGTSVTGLFASLRVGATNTVQLRRNLTTGFLEVANSAGTVLATGTTALTVGTWWYVEIKAFCNGASGTIEVKLNGAAEIASTVVNIGSTALDNMAFFVQNNNTITAAVFDFDDLYAVNTSGSAPLNTFLGDTHCETLLPSGAGAHTDFTPDSGSNYARVNETQADGDTSYVADSTVNHRDSYAYANLAALTGSVFFVQTNLYARKDDAGLRQIAAVARPASTDRDGSTVTLSTTYANYSEIRETNPDTSVAWTISDVNASEFGVKVVT